MDDNNIRVQVLANNIVNIEEIEKVRLNSYGINSEMINSTYFNYIKSGKFLVFACYDGDELIGGAYISNDRNSLYVEQIFIKKEKQRLHIGKHLLNCILQNKELVEMYFHQKFQYSKLESRNCNDFYSSLGYHETSDGINVIMRKKI